MSNDIRPGPEMSTEDDSTAKVAKVRRRTRPFKRYQSSSAAIETVAEELFEQWRPRRPGVKAEDWDAMAEGLRALLACFAANGRHGLSVRMALGRDRAHWYPSGVRSALVWLVKKASLVREDIPPTRDGADDGRGTQGAYTLADSVWDRLEVNCFDTNDLELHCDEFIQLRDDDPDGDGSISLPFGAAEAAKHGLELLLSYQEQLKQYRFELDGIRLEHNEFGLRRIFNNGDWNQGGRWYCDFQQKKDSDRRRLLIDGQAVISLDIKNCHSRLGLGCLGHAPLANDDLYIRVADRLSASGGSRGKREALRGVVKTVWNACLNTKRSTYRDNLESSKKLQDAVSKKLNETERNREAIGAIIEAIKAEFPGVADVFGKNIGMSLQRAESILTENLLRGFLAHHRPIVTIHEGVLIWPEDEQLFMALKAQAEPKMFAFLRDHGWPRMVGVDLPVSIERWLE